MADNLSHYLDNFKASLEVDSAVKESVAKELHTHLEDKSQELKEKGLSEEEADKAAIQALGSTKLIAQQICEVHSQGSWQEAFFAASPHLLLAFFFVSYYWQNIPCLSIILTATVGIAIYGWHRDKPIWLFPWLGYYLLPVIVAGILLISLPQGWTWLGALIYIPLALFVLVYIVKQTANRDWLYVSLMFAPLPVIFSWLSTLSPKNGFLSGNLPLVQLQLNAPLVGISFLALAIATVIFVRVKHRWYKAIALLVPPTVILASVALVGRENIGFWGWLVLFLSLLAFTSPALRSSQQLAVSRKLKTEG